VEGEEKLAASRPNEVLVVWWGERTTCHCVPCSW